MRTLRINTQGDDIAIESGRALVADGTDAIAQSVRTRLLSVRGDYFFDLNDGLPYLDDILVKQADLALVRQIVSECILETPGVQSILELDLDLDQRTRKLSVSVQLRLESNPETVLSTSVSIGLQ